MKRSLFFILFCFSFIPVFAMHVTGGEIIYDYLGPGSSPNTRVYSVTLRLFRDQNGGGAQLPASVGIGIFNNDNNSQFGGYINAPQTGTNSVPIFTLPGCITNPPVLDYAAGYYTFSITLPNNLNGYTITYQTCCRIDNINNTANGIGSTYIGSIPGLNTLPIGIDNSARFQTGINIICYQKPFTLDFSATDPDGDSLVYSLIDAYDGGPANNSGGTCTGCPANFASPIAPPYPLIPYTLPYSGPQPFGSGATINTATGIISGIAPASGRYVVAVLVRSYRNGVFITDHRKDFIITVAPCEIPTAVLNPTYTNCDNLDFHFQNEAGSNVLNLTFNWDFGDPASGANNTSTSETPDHTYSAPGDYTLTLVVNQGTSCEKTATAIVRVWPGFNPSFAPIPPTCKDVPVQFTDLTTTSFPPVNYWHWDFGVTNLTNDTSRLQNPTYTYNTVGTYNVTFIVETVKGCRDTLFPTVTIVDKPEFFITNDTLICTVDTLQLHSNVSTGTITWSPNYMISDIHSFNPLVSPDVPTTYTVTYSDPSGCTATDQVFVNVVTDVTLLSVNDTTLCRGDTATLHLNTDALYFAWTPTSLIVDPTVKDPLVFPTDPLTVFHVKASISNKCFKEKDINVRTVPYPVPIVSGDDPICYGTNSQLHAAGGSIYLWTPSAYLNSSTIPDPVSVFPKQTITYTVAVSDTFGCPKAVPASFTVNVIRLFADAGPSDTSVVLEQPLALHGTGGTTYLWTPSTYLDAPTTPDPVALPLNNITYTLTVSNAIGCTDTDTINVKVFFLPPSIYVPSAFTPGKRDAVNDIFRPIALGIRSLEYFRIYTRWGMLIYSTNKINAGWDGTYKGQPQDPGTFVWDAHATDYKGRAVYKKGTVILIR